MLKIIIFGVGLAHYPIKKFLNYENVDIIAYMDNNPVKIGRTLDEIKIIMPENIKEIKYDYVIISSEGAYRTISQQLMKLGVEKGKIVQAYNYMANFPERFFFDDEEVNDENMKKLFTNNYAFRLLGWIT